MSWLALDDLSKRFGDVTALDSVSLAVEQGEFFTILGPTNAGKTTLLHCVAGLYRPEKGRIHLAGREVTKLEPRARGVSLLFQNNALFPERNGFDNIAFPLQAAGQKGDAVKTRVDEVAAMVNVPHLLDRPPRTYSGGEQQRVAIARALAAPSDLLMLDEPLTNLDARLRIGLRIEFKALHRDLGQTFLYVTHDQVEAISLSDRIAVLDQGRIQQIGSPQQVYDRPENRFVARFIGMPPMNLLPVQVSGDGDGHSVTGQGFSLPIAGLAALSAGTPAPRDLELGIRPEAIRVGRTSAPAHDIPAEVALVEPLGGRTILDLDLAGQPIKAVVPPSFKIEEGAAVFLGFDAVAELLLDPTSDRFLR